MSKKLKSCTENREASRKGERVDDVLLWLCCVGRTLIPRSCIVPTIKDQLRLRSESCSVELNLRNWQSWLRESQCRSDFLRIGVTSAGTYYGISKLHIYWCNWILDEQVVPNDQTHVTNFRCAKWEVTSYSKRVKHARVWVSPIFPIMHLVWYCNQP